jgi:hypothetical protein
MNEKIKQLADKARFVSTATPPTQDEILERFAELIVRECAAQVSRAVESQSILQHFGIKE